MTADITPQSPAQVAGETCRHCHRPVIRCDSLPSHCGCSSGYGWIHAEPWWGHSCRRPGQFSQYARPEPAEVPR